MAIGGSGIPCNTAVLTNGRIEFITMTQNRPAELVKPVEETAAALLAGEYVTVDVRPPYMNPLRELVAKENPAGSGGVS